ncbi:hypothetical protein DY000_02052800 [Brassica cretica]|uniref:Uncharacterized protein n=1 Tax=Brassica cretica TaxID=69181 RepID=A0ABQ7ACD5_BRACR|nr:hypothetical protein DY000_02052800 [Brassica cretica]
MDREARGGSLHRFRTWCQPSNKLSVSRSSSCRREWKLYMQPDTLTSGRSGGVLHVSWTCSQPCGARGAAAHASGAMRSDTRAATNLKLIAPREGSVQLKTEKASSVQSTILYDCDAEALSRLFRPRPVSSFDDQVEVLFRVSTVPWVQISRSNARNSTGKSDELSRSLRRFCPSPDQSVEACQFLHGEADVLSKSISVQSSPVKSSIGFWLSLLRSTSCLSAKDSVSCDQLFADYFSYRFPLLGSWIMAGCRL